MHTLYAYIQSTCHVFAFLFICIVSWAFSLILLSFVHSDFFQAVNRLIGSDCSKPLF